MRSFPGDIDWIGDPFADDDEMSPIGFNEPTEHGACDDGEAG